MVLHRLLVGEKPSSRLGQQGLQRKDVRTADQPRKWVDVSDLPFGDGDDAGKDRTTSAPKYADVARGLSGGSVTGCG